MARRSGLIVYALACALALVASACGQECVDADRDGRGEGCEQGADCDDGDPRLGARCDEQARACARMPRATGCPCLAGADLPCYSGAEGTADVGICRAGMRHCQGGAWGECEGEVAPSFEQCNERDDDCDGRSDERVLSPCGGCDPACTGGSWGQSDAPFSAGTGLELTERGELTLERGQQASSFVFVPSAGDATLSKVDAARAEVVARYALPGEPEHVAIDHLGDAFVLSPARAGVSRLTKVVADEAYCADGDGDGLRTSRAGSERLPEGEDECVAFSLPVGDAGEVAHALAIDGSRGPDVRLGGHAWIAFEESGRVLELSGQDGALLREVPDVGIAPYAATFDAWGRLWLLDRAGVLVQLDPRDDPPLLERIEAPLACYELESIRSDAEGVLLMTGLACEDLVSFDPATRQVRRLQLAGLDVRAASVLGEALFVSHTGGLLSRLTRSPLALEATFELAGDGVEPVDTVAVSADALGRVWTVSTFGAARGLGVLTRFDPELAAVTAQVAIGLLPRAQGDLTGNELVRVLAAEASAEHVFGGCQDDLSPDGGAPSSRTRWRRVHVGADLPRDASLTLEGRHAADRAELARAEYTQLGTLPDEPAPFALTYPDGGLVELRVTLRAAARLGAPRLSRVGIEWGCGGPK